MRFDYLPLARQRVVAVREVGLARTNIHHQYLAIRHADGNAAGTGTLYGPKKLKTARHKDPRLLGRRWLRWCGYWRSRGCSRRVRTAGAATGCEQDECQNAHQDHDPLSYGFETHGYSLPFHQASLCVLARYSSLKSGECFHSLSTQIVLRWRDMLCFTFAAISRVDHEQDKSDGARTDRHAARQRGSEALLRTHEVPRCLCHQRPVSHLASHTPITMISDQMRIPRITGFTETHFVSIP